ncbi:hypothetical protein GF356_08675, partial [candidate division GN15 bacterium]|nr:hypothetical protein [candidate division GN15 bacterium]
MAVPTVEGRNNPQKRDKDISRTKASFTPAYGITQHKVGRMVLGVTNNGSFGGAEFSPAGISDFFTGEEVMACEFPKGSETRYLFGAAFWIGGVIGRDTLVSTGADGWSLGGEEFAPDERPFGELVYRSIIDPEAPEYEDAVSEEDYIAVYTDTSTEGIDADFFRGPHIPLNIEVTQASYAWSYSYAEDIVLFDYKVRNIGTQTLNDMFMGFYVDADIHFGQDGGQTGAQDDLSGFLETRPAPCFSCTYIDTPFIAWTMDNDGDFDSEDEPVPHLTATRIVRTPREGELEVSYNWWVSNGNPQYDFGPRERPYKGELQEPLRDFRTGGTGTPEGDVNKYYLLRNREFDYDQAYLASITSNDPLWLPPPGGGIKDTLTTGLDTRYLLSFGPFNIRPGEVLPISFAYLAGEDVHTNPNNLEFLEPGSYDPDAYYANLDFSDLTLNSRWASWIYDNPGVDTDNDRDSGEVFVCVTDSAVVDSVLIFDPNTGEEVWDSIWAPTEADTCWTKGDGVPDFKGASPPPAPALWVEPGVGKLTVRFNGTRSETTPDVFSREIDFEGYRVYIGRDDRAPSFSVVASYDIEDFNKWVYNPDPKIDDFELLEAPFTLKELRCLYGDS